MGVTGTSAKRVEYHLHLIKILHTSPGRGILLYGTEKAEFLAYDSYTIATIAINTQTTFAQSIWSVVDTLITMPTILSHHVSTPIRF